MILGFALLGLSFGQSSGALSSNFHPRHRYTGSAFTSDLAWLFGAGFAPMVALWLSSEFGLIAAGAYLLSGAIGPLVPLWLNRELASRSEERRVGKECVSTCRSRGARDHSQKKE